MEKHPSGIKPESWLVSAGRASELLHSPLPYWLSVAVEKEVATILAAADQIRSTIPAEQFDFDAAKAVVMEATRLGR